MKAEPSEPNHHLAISYPNAADWVSNLETLELSAMFKSQHCSSRLKQRRESHQKNQVSLQEHNDRMTPGSHVGAQAAIGTPSDRKASSFLSTLLPSSLLYLLLPSFSLMWTILETESRYVTQVSLKLVHLLLLPPEFWGYRCAWPHSSCIYFLIFSPLWILAMAFLSLGPAFLWIHHNVHSFDHIPVLVVKEASENFSFSDHVLVTASDWSCLDQVAILGPITCRWGDEVTFRWSSAGVLEQGLLKKVMMTRQEGKSIEGRSVVLVSSVYMSDEGANEQWLSLSVKFLWIWEAIYHVKILKGVKIKTSFCS